MTSTVYIAKTVYGGDGLGRLGDGRVVFVPGAFAGENVRAEIVTEKRTFVKARLVEVVEPSPDRIGTGEIPIPGMVYANLSPEGETRAKIEQLADFFQRARLEIPEIVPSARPAPTGHYRNKAVYHFAKQNGKWVIGYRLEPGHEIVDVESDPLVVPAINAKLGEIRNGVLMLLTQGPVPIRRETERKGNVTVRWTEKSGVKWWVGDPPADLVLRETTRGKTFDVPADGFYQVNPAVGEELVGAVADAYGAVRETLPELYDLYCGVGVFGLSLNPGKLVGVESGRQAIAFARRNAAALGQPDAVFYAEQVARLMRRLPIGEKSCVIVDPPRGGLEPAVAKALAQGRAPRIFYVSCDPATLIRDLRTLSPAYAVDGVRFFNMFPRTARFETFVSLKRR